MSNKFSFLLQSTLFLVLANPHLALAFRPYQLYTPPSLARQMNVTASGARGCPGKAVDIKALAPKDHVGQTISSNPTILFYVASVPSEKAYFSLVDNNSPEPLYERELTVRQPGVLQVSIPKTVNLKQDRDYIWNLEVVCDRERPSQNWYSRGVFKKVAPPKQLSQQLKNTDNYQKVKSLAKAGIWYDALAISYQQKDDQKMHSYFNKLIQDIGLNSSIK